MRNLYAINKLPTFNTPLRKAGSVIVYISQDPEFTITSEDVAQYGDHLFGFEGEMGCFCYYREATETEIAEMVAKEKEAMRVAISKQLGGLDKKAGKPGSMLAGITILC